MIKNKATKLFDKAVSKLQKVNKDMISAFELLEEATGMLNGDEHLEAETVCNVAEDLIRNATIISHSVFSNVVDKDISQRENDPFDPTEHVKFLVEDTLYEEDDYECETDPKLLN